MVAAEPARKVSFREAAQKMPGEVIGCLADRKRQFETVRQDLAATQFAEVEVDVETGVIRVLKMVGVNNCGIPINPLTAENQLIGAQIQGASWALFEHRTLDRNVGTMVNPNLEAYKILGPADMFEAVAIFTEGANAGNNTSATGMAEPVFVPTLAAIANAVFNAIGVRAAAAPDDAGPGAGRPGGGEEGGQAMNRFEFARATSVAEALSLVAEKPGSVWKAGGIDLLDHLKEHLLEPPRLVDVKSIPGLNGINAEPDGSLRIGPFATMARIAAHPGIRSTHAGLAHACAEAASPQIRNVATIGGNLLQRPRCWYYRLASYRCLKKGGDTCFAVGGENRYHTMFADGACHAPHPSNAAMGLTALGASFVLQGSRGTRTVPAEQFFTIPGNDPRRENAKEPDEILTAIQRAGRAGQALHLRERQGEGRVRLAAGLDGRGAPGGRGHRSRGPDRPRRGGARPASVPSRRAGAPR